ncbi:MAG TPA: cyclic nucleotide-binding domain-containing protein, partial [Vicinamibacterales bacterium]
MIRPDPGATDLALFLRTAAVFESLSEVELRQLSDQLTLSDLEDGTVLIRQDAVSDELYVVITGVLAVSAIDRHGIAHSLGEIRSAGLTGEMHLFSQAPAAATVEARGPVRVAALSRSGFDRFLATCPSGAFALIDALRPRLRRARLWAALHLSEMFAELDRPALIDLESAFELVSLYGGEVLFEQGDPADSLYIVVSGRLRVVSLAADGSDRLLAELGVGETVGEMGVISGEPRSATVYASRDTQLAKLSKTAVDAVVERHPHAMLSMLTSRLIARVRVMSNGDRRRSDVATIAVVPAGSDVPHREFAAALAAALTRLGPTLHVSSALVDGRLGRPGVAQAHDRDGGSSGLLDWLARQEIDYRFVVYETDPGLTPWTERCIRQADRAVLAANADGDPAIGEIEGQLLAPDARRRPPVTLALIHADDGPCTSGTEKWLAARAVERHVHVHGIAAGYERLARFLTGRAVGLALGGGFARGLAHLGVFRALRELNIPIDAIGGSSMGAIIAAQWALGREAPRILHETRTCFADSFDDMTLPFLSFKRGGKASQVIRQLFEHTRIEDLWIPFFSVSANLNRAELKVHTAGPLADAVLASSRAPGIFPPLVIDGELHVDGGVI